GPVRAVGIDLQVLRPVVSQPFAQQQGDGATQAVAADDDAQLGTIVCFKVAVSEFLGGEKSIVEPSVGLWLMGVLLLVALVPYPPGSEILEYIAERYFHLGATKANEHQLVVVGNESLGMGLLVIEEVHVLGIAPALGRFGLIALGIVGHDFQAFGI